MRLDEILDKLNDIICTTSNTQDDMWDEYGDEVSEAFGEVVEELEDLAGELDCVVGELEELAEKAAQAVDVIACTIC